MTHTTSRVLALLNLLQTHQQWSGPDLARRLEVTQRTLRRDIERLRELGYRVEAQRGAAGGYRLEAGAQLPPLLLTDDEAVAMVLGLRATANLGISGGESTSMSALAKFEQVLPAALRARVTALSRIVEVRTPGAASVAPDVLGKLALACRDRERIRFSYVSAAGEATHRSVEPHSLVSSQRRWILVCWDRDRADWRSFRVDRIADLASTRVLFEPRQLPADDAAQFVAASIASLREQHSADVILHVSLTETRARFDGYARDAEEWGVDRTRWPIVGSSREELLSSLAWIPLDVEFELRGTPEFMSAARAWSHQLRRAVDRSLDATAVT